MTTDTERRLTGERLAAQLLSGRPAATPGAVVERLLAVQGQDPRGARLSVRARTRGLTAADVDRALNDRELLITWLNRGTLHLVRSEDYWWLHAVTTPQLRTGNARRLAQEGVSPAAAERGVAAVTKALSDGPLTRAQLRERIRAANVRTEGQALVHVLMLTSLRGIAVRGPLVGTDQAYVLARDWLGVPPEVDRDVALRELARRYLVGHGPASDRDLATWAGVPLRDARRGLAAIGDHVYERPGGLLAMTATPGRLPAVRPRLLGPYDPLLLGWTSREALLGKHRDIVTVNGLFRPFALVGGRAVGTWAMPEGRVDLTLLDPVSATDAKALDTEAADIERFLGRPRA